MIEDPSNFNKRFLPIYFLGGFFSLAFSGIYILNVPLSELFWPGEVYHALEMGVLISSMFLAIAFSGILFGRLIDKYSRVKILFVVSIVRGTCMILLSITVVGQGLESWLYFYIITFIFAFFAGGNYPSVVSLSHDIVPIDQRSSFFGIYNLVRNAFQLTGFLFVGLLDLLGLWRLFFIIIGLAILISGINMFFNMEEPKRGSQNKELKEVLKIDSVEYDFQIDLDMMKKTMLSKTNLVILIEGISTNIFMGSLTFLLLPYIQTDPHNISPFATGIFLAVFGLTGGIIGQILLARLSDKLSKQHHIRRIYLIIISLIGGAVCFTLLFFIPLPHLNKSEGQNLLLFIMEPMILLMGVIHASSTSISALYNTNQGPIIQEINLPEAQGQIISWNRLLESISFGSGPLISGIFITISGQNYQLVAILIGLFTIPGILLWISAIKYYSIDRENISSILESRSLILESKKDSTKS
ncbi:MAG: MFS transporter [Promethearchaeota archaeon]|nr:MAG: MFS transporter [Candidatus Lokiarchaeota archaeon]